MSLIRAGQIKATTRQCYSSWKAMLKTEEKITMVANDAESAEMDASWIRCAASQDITLHILILSFWPLELRR